MAIRPHSNRSHSKRYNELQAMPERSGEDGLWNERFQGLVRAALLGENADGLNFEDTVRRAIDCRIEGLFDDGARAINYLTSHDTEGRRKERLYNLMEATVSLSSSERLFDRQAIETGLREKAAREGREATANDIRDRQARHRGGH